MNSLDSKRDICLLAATFYLIFVPLHNKRVRVGYVMNDNLWTAQLQTFNSQCSSPNQSFEIESLCLLA